MKNRITQKELKNRATAEDKPRFTQIEVPPSTPYSKQSKMNDDVAHAVYQGNATLIAEHLSSEGARRLFVALGKFLEQQQRDGYRFDGPVSVLAPFVGPPSEVM